LGEINLQTHTARSGLLYALFGFALLSCGDTVIKSIAGAWPGPAVAALRYTAGATGLGLLLAIKEGRQGFSLPRPAVQLLRGAALATATVLFFSSIFLMPLAEATAIGFTTPIITSLLSAVFLKEKIRASTWIASVVAFAGVLLILKPNLAELGWVAVMPLGAATCMAAVMMGNRAVACAGSPLLMQFLAASIALPFVLGFAATGHLSGVATLQIGWPDVSIVLRCCLVAITASFAHWLIFMATTRASASQVAPMSYVQLLVATTTGIALFGDWPDLTSLAGSAIIIAAGLYLWRQKRS
jgi:drug/metabolite transporter (DMT)-like permease